MLTDKEYALVLEVLLCLAIIVITGLAVFLVMSVSTAQEAEKAQSLTLKLPQQYSCEGAPELSSIARSSSMMHW